MYVHILLPEGDISENDETYNNENNADNDSNGNGNDRYIFATNTEQTIVKHRSCIEFFHESEQKYGSDWSQITAS